MTDAPSRPDAAIDAAVDTAVDGPPPPDLSCLGEAPAMDAPDPFDLTGKVFAVDHYQVHAEPGAIVTVRRRADDTVIATAPATADDGSYAVSIATGGVALDAYYTITDGTLATRIDPGDPLTTGFFALAITASTDEIERWYTDAGATFDATAPTLIAVVVDCQHAAVAGATIAVGTPGAKVTYYDPAVPRWDPSATSSPNGFALVTGGVVTETITASWQGHAFPAHAFVAPVGGLSLAVVSPHADAELRAKR